MTAPEAQAITSTDAARLLLLGQGLLDPPDGDVDENRVLEVVRRLGFVQIDSINAVERAHHLTLLARLDNYHREHMVTLLEERRALFEQWTHDASVIPTAWYPHWRPRFRRSGERIRRTPWWASRMGDRPEQTLKRVLDRIRSDGPLQARDFVDSVRGGSDKWWGWKPEKAALEYLWRTGEIAVVRRVRFEKVYDLSERVFPDHHALPGPEHDAHVDWACASAMDRLVVATPMEIAAFWRSIDIADVRRWCSAMERTGGLVRVIIAGPGKGGRESQGSSMNSARVTYALPDWRERLDRSPEPPSHIRALSPFDPIVRDRDRAQRLFGFDFRFEAFVPAVKRQYGYYTLPLLEGDRLVGRVTARTDRRARELVIEGLWWEPGVRPTRARRASLDEALLRVARFAGADRLATSSKS